MVYLDADRESFIRESHPEDSEIWMIVYEGIFADVINPGSSSSLFNSVSWALQGDALLSDKMQAEGGQGSVIPEWFNKGVELLRDKGLKGDDAITYLEGLTNQLKNGAT